MARSVPRYHQPRIIEPVRLGISLVLLGSFGRLARLRSRPHPPRVRSRLTPRDACPHPWHRGGCTMSPQNRPTLPPLLRVLQPVRRRRSAGRGRRRRSRRAANQAQPSARPASTSVSQWTSSSTRLTATATAMPTATPASAGQARRPHQRPATSAKAAQDSGGGRGVAAGERRPERRGHGLERRAGAIDEVLDRLGEELVSEHDREQERHDPAAARPRDLDQPPPPPRRRPPSRSRPDR